MRKRTLMNVLLGTVALLVVASPAAAQNTGDVSFGYSFLRLMDEGDSLNIPAGWNVSFAGNATDLFSAVGEVGGHYKSEDGSTLKIHSFMAGVRVAARGNPRVVPFAQVLGGGAYGSVDGDGSWDSAIQPGGGVDFRLNDSDLLIRAQADFPIYFEDGETFNGFRATFSVVVPTR